MTIKDWDPDEYEFDFGQEYYEGEVVNAPLTHKASHVFRYLLENMIPDAVRAYKGGGELSCLLTTFCIVEYLTGYFSGKQSTEKSFSFFVDKYFPQEYQSIYPSLYQLRCSLVHNLVFTNPWKPSVENPLIEENSANHLKLIEGKLVFSIAHFLEDTRRSIIIYFDELIKVNSVNSTLVINFHKRFNRKNGSASVMVKI
jgi:hypothetical protein